MQRVHRFALLGMQVPLRMEIARWYWRQTVAELRRAMATNQASRSPLGPGSDPGPGSASLNPASTFLT
jgi:hypothetical protein